MADQTVNYFDLQYFDRFDAITGALQAKLSEKGVNIVGTLEGGPGFALFLDKKADRMAIKSVSENGIQITARGKGAKPSWLSCSSFIREIELRGGAIPQVVDLVLDQKNGAYFGALKKEAGAPEGDTKGPKRVGGGNS